MVVSAALAFLVAFRIMKLQGKVLNWFFLMLLAAAWWTLTYGLELASTTLQQMMFFIRLEYLGISLIPAFWLLFSLEYTQQERPVSSIVYFGMFSYSALTYFLVLTNEFHHLHYQSVAVDYSGPFPLLDINPGPWYRVHTIVFYLLVITGYVYLLLYFRGAKTLFRRHSRMIVLSTLIPLLVNVGYIAFDLRPHGHIDLTPVAFLVSSMILSAGLMRYGLFDLLPLARNSTFNFISDGVLVLDAQDRILDFNPALNRMVQNQAENLIGRPCQELLVNYPEWDFEAQEHHELQLGSRILELSRTAINNKGRVSGSIVLLRDITVRRQAELAVEKQRFQLQELNQQKDRLFSIIAHDLRGPLRNLQEILRMMNAADLSSEEKDELLQILPTSVDGSVVLMENLLAWAKSQQEGEQIKPQEFDLGDLAAEVMNNLAAIAEKKGVALKNAIENLGVKIFADREMMRIVLRNLINNAVKFTNPGGYIQVNSRLDEGRCIIIVEDNGVGMDEQTVSELFSLKVKSRKGTADEVGSGLGLALCKEYVLKNHGTLEAESEPGKGSRFILDLPAGS